MSTSTQESKRLWSYGMKSVKRNGNQCQSCAYTSLPKDFFTELIRLEADFHMKNYTLETLNELTQYYARAVEHYDSFKDEITSYFIFKIQDILATKKSLMMLKKETQKGSEKKENKVPNIQDSEKDRKEKKPLFEIQQNPSLEDNSESDEDNSKFKSSRVKSNRKKSPGSTIAQMRNKKKRFVHLFYKIEDQLVNEKENMNETVNVYHNSKAKNDDLVKNDISKQKQRIQKKLEQKKYESFMSQTMNSNSFQFSSRNQHAYSDILERKEQSDRTLELMLKELDENEDDEGGQGVSMKKEESSSLTNKSYSDGSGSGGKSGNGNEIGKNEAVQSGFGKSGFFSINNERFKQAVNNPPLTTDTPISKI